MCYFANIKQSAFILQLEEFRKKKAAEKAKKTTSSSQLHLAGAGLQEKQASQSDPVRVTDSDGAGTSDGVGGAFIESSSVVMDNDHKTTEFVHKTDLGSSDDTHAGPLFSANNYNIYSADPFQTRTKDEKFRDASTGPVNLYASPKEKGTINNYSINSGTLARRVDGIAREQITSFYSPSVQDSDSSSSKYSNYGLGEALSSDGDSRLKDVADAGTSLVPERHGSILLHNKSAYNDLRANDARSSSYGGKANVLYCCSVAVPVFPSFSLPLYF